jgi:hypothetical protein
MIFAAPEHRTSSPSAGNYKTKPGISFVLVGTIPVVTGPHSNSGEGRIEPREILNLTVMFDHDVIDGAPATCFTRRLVELIESGYGLAETDVIVDGLFSQDTGRPAPIVSVAANRPNAIAANITRMQ